MKNFQLKIRNDQIVQIPCLLPKNTDEYWLKHVAEVFKIRYEYIQCIIHIIIIDLDMRNFLQNGCER